jgi:hypothetical protein
MQKAPNPPCMRDLDLHNSLFSLLIGLSTSPLDVHFPIRAHKAGLARSLIQAGPNFMQSGIACAMSARRSRPVGTLRRQVLRDNRCVVSYYR